MKIAGLLVLLTFTLGVYAQEMSVEKFQKLANEAGMEFTMPEGYTITEVKENKDLYYDFAILNESGSMEVRYTIWPLDAMLKQYEASLLDSNTTMVSPNTIYKGRIQANALNMTSGQLPDIGSFPPQAVKREFNADDGGSCFFRFNCEFGEGYEIGQFMYLHKDNVADAIVTFMSNDIETHSDLMSVPFHSLKFKP